MKRDHDGDQMVNCSVESPAGLISIKNCHAGDDLRNTVANTTLVPTLKSDVKSGAHTINATSFELFDRSADDNASLERGNKIRVRYRPTTAAN